jgi:hypothetical protein
MLHLELAMLLSCTLPPGDSKCALFLLKRVLKCMSHVQLAMLCLAFGSAGYLTILSSPADPLNVDEMYILVSAPGCLPRYIGVRGCSSLEGYHRHLNALLGAGNYSPELAGALIALFNYRWNYECAVRSKGAKDWGMFDHWLLEAMQDTCAAMGWPNPCPEWRRAPSTEERFGVHAAPGLMQTGVSREDGEQELEVLDQEAAFVEAMLEEQQSKSTQAVGKPSFSC